jgi:hypothetical protein
MAPAINATTPFRNGEIARITENVSSMLPGHYLGEYLGQPIFHFHQGVLFTPSSLLYFRDYLGRDKRHLVSRGTSFKEELYFTAQVADKDKLERSYFKLFRLDRENQTFVSISQSPSLDVPLGALDLSMVSPVSESLYLPYPTATGNIRLHSFDPATLKTVVVPALAEYTYANKLLKHGSVTYLQALNVEGDTVTVALDAGGERVFELRHEEGERLVGASEINGNRVVITNLRVISSSQFSLLAS